VWHGQGRQQALTALRVCDIPLWRSSYIGVSSQPTIAAQRQRVEGGAPALSEMFDSRTESSAGKWNKVIVLSQLFVASANRAQPLLASRQSV
jgi:hypothetical protein